MTPKHFFLFGVVLVAGGTVPHSAVIVEVRPSRALLWSDESEDRHFIHPLHLPARLSDQAIAYMNRAEAIKSAIKKKDEEPPAPTSPASVDRQGSSGQAATMAKPKTESKEAKDKDPGVDSELEKLKKQLEGSIVSGRVRSREHHRIVVQ